MPLCGNIEYRVPSTFDNLREISCEKHPSIHLAFKPNPQLFHVHRGFRSRTRFRIYSRHRPVYMLQIRYTTVLQQKKNILVPKCPSSKKVPSANVSRANQHSTRSKPVSLELRRTPPLSSRISQEQVLLSHPSFQSLLLEVVDTVELL
jgi:hypothetical protein